MGMWRDTTKEMVRPQSVLGYPEPEDEPAPPAPAAPPSSVAADPPTRRRTFGRADRGGKPPDEAVVAKKTPLRESGVSRALARGGAAPKPSAPDAGPPKAPSSRPNGAATGTPAGRGAGKANGDEARSTRSSRLPMDPRFKERWVRVRREQGHRRLRAAVAAGAVVVVIAGGVGAAFSPLLAVRHIRVAATPHVAIPQVLAVTGLADHRPMVEVNAGAAASRLDGLPWVASARVSRQWPSTVTVTIRERRAVAQVSGPGGSVVVDATGRVLTTPQAATAGLPTLIGAPPAGRPGTWLAGGSLRTPPRGAVGVSLAVASALPAPVANRVATVSVDGHGVVTLALMPGPTTVSLGEVAAPGDPATGTAVTGSTVPVTLARQVAALSTLLSTVDLSKVGQIDLTVPDRPALTPAQTPTTLSTTSRG